MCLAPFEAGELVRELPCGHLYHKACIDEWLLDKGRPPADPNGGGGGEGGGGGAGGGGGLRGLAACPLCKAVPIQVGEPKLPSPPSVGAALLAPLLRAVAARRGPSRRTLPTHQHPSPVTSSGSTAASSSTAAASSSPPASPPPLLSPPRSAESMGRIVV